MSHLVLLTVGTSDWGNSFSMPLVLGKMLKVSPVAAQVITFKNDGALCPYLGYLYPYRIFRLSMNFLTVHATIGYRAFGAEHMLVLVVV